MHTHSAAAEQRRMIYTEDKAKVVAAVLGDVPGWYEEKDELRQVDHPILQIVLVENSQSGKELNKLCPLNSNDDLCLVACKNPASLQQNHVSSMD